MAKCLVYTLARKKRRVSIKAVLSHKRLFFFFLWKCKSTKGVLTLLRKSQHLWRFRGLLCVKMKPQKLGILFQSLYTLLCLCYLCNYPSVSLSSHHHHHFPSSLAPFIIQSRGLRKVGHMLEQELLPPPLNKVQSMHSRLLILQLISIKILVVHILITSHLLQLRPPLVSSPLSVEWPRKWGAHWCFSDTYVYVFICLVLFLFIGEYNTQICVNEEAATHIAVHLPSPQTSISPLGSQNTGSQKVTKNSWTWSQQLKTAGANKYSDT